MPNYRNMDFVTWEKIFTSANQTGVISGIQAKSDIEFVGVLESEAAPEYMLRVVDHRPSGYIGNGVKTVIISALIQDKLSMQTEAHWSSLTAASVATKLAEELSTAGVYRSLVGKYTSRRLWTGTDPISFSIPMQFKAVNNAEREVVAPCRELQRLSLPFSGHDSDSSNAKKYLLESLLSPPGPTPYAGLRGYVLENLGQSIPIEEQIDIFFGRFLTFKNVIVKNISIEIPNKFLSGGMPIGALATIQFQTYEIITKETLDNIYTRIDSQPDTIASGAGNYENYV
ncbi:MAG: hypothetical protein PHV11_06135 [Candidatus Bipolaricaulis sp.]|nr:hypothetical protein [Candidatus Bipolaricaulis sp.]